MHTLAIDYGQRHRHELAAAARVAASLGAASHRVISIDLRAFGGSALTADVAVPKDRPASEMSHGIPITYVPARNLIFLSLAAAAAETLGARDIYIGVNAVDFSGYPDCRPEFVRAFEAAANLGTQTGVEGRTLHIRAPLVHMSKAEIIRLGVSLGVDYALTHSCYDPVVRTAHRATSSPAALGGQPVPSAHNVEAALACGHCDSCQLRREGFQAAGIADPTHYA